MHEAGASIDNPGRALKVSPLESPLVLPTPNMADEKVPVEYTEKNAIAGSTDLESSGTKSPPIEDDDLPDPDVGKSDEERAKLVGLLRSSPCNV